MINIGGCSLLEYWNLCLSACSLFSPLVVLSRVLLHSVLQLFVRQIFSPQTTFVQFTLSVTLIASHGSTLPWYYSKPLELRPRAEKVVHRPQPEKSQNCRGQVRSSSYYSRYRVQGDWTATPTQLSPFSQSGIISCELNKFSKNCSHPRPPPQIPPKKERLAKSRRLQEQYLYVLTLSALHQQFLIFSLFIFCTEPL